MRAGRGGTGLFYSSSLTVDAFWPKYNTQIARIQITNDGRPNFAADPLNGKPLPTFAEALKLFCDAPEQAANFAAWAAKGYSGTAPCLFNSLQEMPGPTDLMHMPRSWNSSIGVQRQFGNTMALQVDYVQTQGSHEKDVLDNANLAYNPATGANYASTNANRGLLPWPSAGVISMIDTPAGNTLKTTYRGELQLAAAAPGGRVARGEPGGPRSRQIRRAGSRARGGTASRAGR